MTPCDICGQPATWTCPPTVRIVEPGFYCEYDARKYTNLGFRERWRKMTPEELEA